MIAALASTEFLSTNTTSSLFDSPNAYIVFGLAVVFLILSVFLHLRENPLVILTSILVLFFSLLPFAVNFGEQNIQNKANLMTNIQTVYDLDKVEIESARGELFEAIAIKGGTAYRVLISQDKDTFEPYLASLNENDHSISMDDFKREK